MHLDEIDGYVGEAIEFLHSNQAASALLTLTKIQGIISVLLDDLNKWDRIQKAYESGVRPKELARRFGVTAGQVKVKACRERWPNPYKLAKEASVRKNKNIFHICCKECELYFEAPSGHAKVCPTCKAFENMGKERAS